MFIAKHTWASTSNNMRVHSCMSGVQNMHAAYRRSLLASRTNRIVTFTSTSGCREAHSAVALVRDTVNYGLDHTAVVSSTSNELVDLVSELHYAKQEARNEATLIALQQKRRRNLPGTVTGGISSTYVKAELSPGPEKPFASWLEELTSANGAVLKRLGVHTGAIFEEEEKELIFNVVAQMPPGSAIPAEFVSMMRKEKASVQADETSPRQLKWIPAATVVREIQDLSVSDVWDRISESARQNEKSQGMLGTEGSRQVKIKSYQVYLLAAVSKLLSVRETGCYKQRWKAVSLVQLWLEHHRSGASHASSAMQQQETAVINGLLDRWGTFWRDKMYSPVVEELLKENQGSLNVKSYAIILRKVADAAKDISLKFSPDVYSEKLEFKRLPARVAEVEVQALKLLSTAEPELANDYFYELLRCHSIINLHDRPRIWAAAAGVMESHSKLGVGIGSRVLLGLLECVSDESHLAAIRARYETFLKTDGSGDTRPGAVTALVASLCRTGHPEEAIKYLFNLYSAAWGARPQLVPVVGKMQHNALVASLLELGLGLKAAQVVHHMQWPDTPMLVSKAEYFGSLTSSHSRSVWVYNNTLRSVVDFAVQHNDSRYLYLVTAVLQARLVSEDISTRAWSSLLHGAASCNSPQVVEQAWLTLKSCPGDLYPSQKILRQLLRSAGAVHRPDIIHDILEHAKTSHPTWLTPRVVGAALRACFVCGDNAGAKSVLKRLPSDYGIPRDCAAIWAAELYSCNSTGLWPGWEELLFRVLTSPDKTERKAFSKSLQHFLVDKYVTQPLGGASPPPLRRRRCEVYDDMTPGISNKMADIWRSKSETDDSLVPSDHVVMRRMISELVGSTTIMSMPPGQRLEEAKEHVNAVIDMIGLISDIDLNNHRSGQVAKAAIAHTDKGSQFGHSVLEIARDLMPKTVLPGLAGSD